MKSNDLENSTEYVNEISVEMSEEELKPSKIQDRTRALAELNHDLDKIITKTKKKIKLMEFKATCSILAYKFMLGLIVLLSAANVVISFTKYKTQYEKVGPSLSAAFAMTIGWFNFQKQSLRQKKLAMKLKGIIRKCIACRYQNDFDTKIYQINKIRTNISAIDFDIYKSDYGIEQDEKNSIAVT